MFTELLAGLENINKPFQPSGLSLLSIAVANEALECVKILLKAGADPNQWDLSNKITAMHAVAQSGLHTRELLELLVQHGGNINNGMERNGGNSSSIEHIPAKASHIVLKARPGFARSVYGKPFIP